MVDTALMVQLKKANDLLLTAIDRMLDVLADKAREHRYTLMMAARTASMPSRRHGV